MSTQTGDIQHPSQRDTAKPVDGGRPAHARDDASWVQTYTGRRFFPLDPDPEEIDPVDIAHSLSLQCRYNGHVDQMYSVAEHTILVSQAVPAEHAMWGLLHDATEAYVGDMVRPLKRHMPDYQAIENTIMLAVMHRFGLPVANQARPWDMPEQVKEVDTRVILDERAAMHSNTRYPWQHDLEQLQPLGVTVVGYPSAVVEQMWLERFAALGGK